MNLIIEHNPPIQRLRQLEVWLKQEYEKIGEGFYCNWNIIEDAYNKNQLLCATFNDSAIGLLVWRKWENFGFIEILSINPKDRKQKIGASLTIECESYFMTEKVTIVHVDCHPLSSHLFWKKQGYTDCNCEKYNPNGNSAFSIKLHKKLNV